MDKLFNNTLWQVLWAPDGGGSTPAPAAGGDGAPAAGAAGGAPAGEPAAGAAAPAGGDGDGEDAASGDGDAAAGDKPSGDTIDVMKRRIAQLAREKGDNARRADESQRVADVAIEELRALKDANAGGTPAASAAPQPAGLRPGTPEFQAAVAAQAAQDRFVERCNTVFNDGNKKYKDFETVVNSDLNTVLGAGTNPAFYSTVTALDAAHDVLYYLGKNLKEAEVILALPPARQAVELAKIELKLTAPGTSKGRVSGAPAPVNPINADVEVNTTELSDDQPIDAWMAARNKQVANRQQR